MARVRRVRALAVGPIAAVTLWTTGARAQLEVFDEGIEIGEWTLLPDRKSVV